MVQWVLWACVAAAWAVTCPPVTCTSLGSSVCAMRSADTMQINANGCPAEMECKATALFQWWFTVLGTDSYSCQSLSGFGLPSGSGPFPCREYVAQRNFQSLNTLMECVEDQDCVMEDGSYSSGQCLCALRSSGKGLCQPDYSNLVFSGYWDACGSANSIDDSVEYAYWNHYITNWVYLQSDLSCFSFISEVAEMMRLGEQYSSAAGLLLFSLIAVA